MKFLILLATLSLAVAAPQPRKVFHENFEDFVHLIETTVGDEIEHLLYHYLEFEEFLATVNYLSEANFKKLMYEMEELPEFKAVVDYLEGHNIDMTYYIDGLNNMLEYGPDFEDDKRRSLRHGVSGRDFSAYTRDLVNLLPKDQLNELYNQKVAEDEDFKAAMEGLQSDEWKEIYAALWESEGFLAQITTLGENGLDVSLVMEELVAVFGQN
ncbi:hypothetical protein ACJJTC_000323 [Scirpophaga incertulas]